MHCFFSGISPIGFPQENPLSPNIQVSCVGHQRYDFELQTGESNDEFIIAYTP